MGQDDDRSPMRFAGVGAELAGSVLAGLLLGYLFDLWRDTAPVGIVTGALLGLVGGFYNFIKAVTRGNRD